MKKLKPPKGWRMLKPSEILNHDDRFFYGGPMQSCPAGCRAGWLAEKYGGIGHKYGYTSCYIRKISKPKKIRQKKSLGQIAYEARYDVCDWNICSFKDLWQRCGEAVAKAVRRRMANK